jgi:hypothetical protein
MRSTSNGSHAYVRGTCGVTVRLVRLVVRPAASRDAFVQGTYQLIE